MQKTLSDCEHKEKRKDPRHGIIYCCRCGLVLDTVIRRGRDYRICDDLQEKRTYNTVEKHKPYNNLGTRISIAYVDSKVKEPHMHRLRFWDSVHTNKIKNVAYSFIDVLRSRFSYPENLFKRTARLFNEIYKIGLKNHKTEYVVFAIFLNLAEAEGYFIPAREACDNIGLEKKQVLREKKYTNQMLDIVTSTSRQYSDAVEYMGLEYNFSNAVIYKAKEIIDQVIRKGVLAGKTKPTISLAVLCYVDGYKPVTKDFRGRGATVQKALKKLRGCDL